MSLLTLSSLLVAAGPWDRALLKSLGLWWYQAAPTCCLGGVKVLALGGDAAIPDDLGAGRTVGDGVGAAFFNLFISTDTIMGPIDALLFLVLTIILVAIVMKMYAEGPTSISDAPALDHDINNF